MPTPILYTILAILTFLVYLFSLCPTVYLIDSGELATVSYTLGIAHPTGYPLYTLISYFFAHLPGEPIVNLNVLSALFTVTAALFVYLTTKQILKDRWVPLLCASLFAFSPSVWRVSVINEVYSLTGLFAILIIYVLFTLRDERGFYIIMYLIGLSLTNHIIILSLALTVFCYIILVYRPPLKKIMLGVIFALLGVSVYLYLITRTTGGAELAWGNTHNLQRLFWHITGKQYRVWMFSLPMSEILNNLQMGITILLKDFLFIFIVPIILGLHYLFKSERKIFWLLSVILLLNTLYTINYSIPDIESYYIPGFISLLILFSYGLRLMKKFLKWFIVIPIAVIIPIVNYPVCTLRNNTFGLDLSRAHIEQLPEQSLLLCTYWDIYSPTLYLQHVKKVRQDLVIVDKELLRRTWYITYLENEYPEFYRKVEDTVGEYLMELYKFEYDRSYDPLTIQMRFIRMLEAFVDAKTTEGVYFTTYFTDRDLDAVKPHYRRIPWGLVFEIREDTANYIPFDFSKLDITRPTIVNDERLRHNLEITKRLTNINYTYLMSIKNFTEAEQVKDWLDNF